MSIRLLSWLHCAFLAASSLTDCFRPASCTSAIIGVYALRNSLPLVVWLRYRFIQAAIALSLALPFVALLLMLVVGFRCVFCFDFCFSISTFAHPRSSLLQHFITPSVFTHRPFALYLCSWRVLLAYAFRTSLGIKLRPVFIIDCGRWRIRTASSSQAFRGITAAVVGCRSISSVGGPSIPLIPSLPVCSVVSGFFLPYVVSWHF